MLSAKAGFLMGRINDDQEIFSTALKKPVDQQNSFINNSFLGLRKINIQDKFSSHYHSFAGANFTCSSKTTAKLFKKSDLPRLSVKPLYKYAFFFAALLAAIAFFPHSSFAQKKNLLPVSKLKKLSVEELMNIEVTSVSKTPQKLTEVASAIQVLTGEDIRRSPTTLLPEVLRLAPNLQVTRSGSHDWTVTARGFNGYPIANSSLSNKLLVTIDGRVVYNPLFGGVYWDVQGLLKDDIDRIEIVSGPGGTLWGANAVNGVINMTTKNARETQGLSGSVSYGNYLQDGFAVRYGSHIDSSFYFRVYANRFDYNSSRLKDGSSANDEWNRSKGGFRIDYMPSAKNNFTLQGDIYGGNEDVNDSTKVSGMNILGRWSHPFSVHSNLTIQGYFDNTYRNIKPTSFKDAMNTFDIDLQHSFLAGSKNNILWGLGYRTLDDHIDEAVNTFVPQERMLNLFNGFLQDQLTVIPKRLELTVGTKLLYNDYTHFEWQPSARLAWLPSGKQTIWAAVSRAVRTPSRFEEDLVSFHTLNFAPFNSEKVIAYELGYRTRPAENISLSLATFYNNYTDQRSLNATGDPVVPVVFGNSLESRSWGIEFSGNYVKSKYWRLRGGATLQDKKFSATAANVFTESEKFEAIDPAFQATLQSILDLPENVELDFLARFVSKLSGSATLNIPDVPAYFSLDARIGWNYRMLSFSLSAQNITDASHPEFGSREIPRSISAKIGFHF